MDMIGRVRRMKLRDQLSLSEIAKRTGLARNTVKKLLKAPSEVVPRYERGSVEGKLTAFESTLHQALTSDSHRPKQGRRSGRALFAQIQARVTAAATAPSPTTSAAGGCSPWPARPKPSFP